MLPLNHKLIPNSCLSDMPEKESLLHVSHFIMNAASLFPIPEMVISGFVSVLFWIKAFSPKHFFFFLYLHAVSSFQMGEVEIA